MNMKNTIVNNIVPPANDKASNIPNTNNGRPKYCIINGKNVA